MTLWTRDFGLYFAGRTVSLSGGSMVPMTWSLVALEAGYGASGVGYVLASAMGFMAVFLPLGGVLADRFTPRRVMIYADLARVLVQAVTVALFLGGTPGLGAMIVLAGVSGAMGGIFQPGVASMIALVADDVQKANAALRTSQSITLMTGPALAGLLIAVMDAAVVFAFNGLTFVFSAACLLAMRPAGECTPSEDESMLHNLRRGWAEFRAHAWLWPSVLIWTMFGLTVAGPFLPICAELIATAHGPGGYSLVASAFGGGSVLGGLLAMWVRPRRPLATGATTMLLFACAPISVAADLPLAVLIVGACLGGLGFAVWSMMLATTMQTRIPTEALSRVSSYEVTGSFMSVPLGRVLAGPMATTLEPRTALHVCSALGIGWCLCLLAVPAIRNVRAIAPAKVAPANGDAVGRA